jgi:hypothetical protein
LLECSESSADTWQSSNLGATSEFDAVQRDKPTTPTYISQHRKSSPSASSSSDSESLESDTPQDVTNTRARLSKEKFAVTKKIAFQPTEPSVSSQDHADFQDTEEERLAVKTTAFQHTELSIASHDHADHQDTEESSESEATQGSPKLSSFSKKFLFSADYQDTDSSGSVATQDLAKRLSQNLTKRSSNLSKENESKSTNSNKISFQPDEFSVSTQDHADHQETGSKSGSRRANPPSDDPQGIAGDLPEDAGHGL